MTTQNMLIGGALVLSAAALVVGGLALIGILTPGDDQPITMVGGSLKMSSARPWKRTAEGYRYKSNRQVTRVEWWCNPDEVDPHVAERSGEMRIAITYGNGNGQAHEINLSTDKNGQPLIARLSKPGGTDVPRRFLRALIELGEHPEPWQIRSVSGTGLVELDTTTPKSIDCASPAEMTLTIRTCSAGECD